MRCSRCRKEISGVGKPAMPPVVPALVAIAGSIWGLFNLTLGQDPSNALPHWSPVFGWGACLGSLALASVLVWIGLARRKCPECGSTQMLDAMEEEGLTASERLAAQKAAIDEALVGLGKKPPAEIEREVRAQVEAELRAAQVKEAADRRAALEKEVREDVERRMRAELERQSVENERSLRKKVEELRSQLETELRSEIEQQLRAAPVAEVPPAAAPAATKPVTPPPATTAKATVASPAPATGPVTPPPITTAKAMATSPAPATRPVTPPPITTAKAMATSPAPATRPVTPAPVTTAKAMATSPAPATRPVTPAPVTTAKAMATSTAPAARPVTPAPITTAKAIAVSPAPAARPVTPAPITTAKAMAASTVPQSVAPTAASQAAAKTATPAPGPTSKTVQPDAPHPEVVTQPLPLIASVVKLGADPQAPAVVVRTPAPQIKQPVIDGHERAKRRARVILSDLSAYHRDELLKAAAATDAKQALGTLWRDAVMSYNEVASPEIRSVTNYLEEELNRYLVQLRSE